MRAIAAIALTVTLASAAAERVTLHVAGQELVCDVLKITKSEVTIKTGGKEQTLPLQVLNPKDVYECYKQVMEPKNAALRFDMGSYFAKKGLYDEAKIELVTAMTIDASYKPKVEDILKTLPGYAPPKSVAAGEAPKKTEPPPKKPDEAAQAVKPPKAPKEEDEAGFITISANDTPESIMAKLSDFRKSFRQKNVPPRSEAEMKAFLTKRLEELNKKIGGSPWRMVETKHFYCFANVPEPKHNGLSKSWNEGLYDLLCRVLNHKDGDKLWNNKMPIYYFEAFKQFQKFAAEIDGSPGAGYSGGYFSAEGREVHICIPFMSEHFKANTEAMDSMARNTLFHEGTHAFLQLSGEDVYLSRWLHEGLAQFIEFWYEGDKHKEKKDRVQTLKEYVQYYKVPLTWEESQERPRSGRDVMGYCCAYAKLEFLYRQFPNQCLPAMIKDIKKGKTEKEAMEKAFGMPPDQLEDKYFLWIKTALKQDFKF